MQPGTRLGAYEVQSPLGVGGMGEVYKARDPRLDRTVAIKVLPEHVASDPALKQRFEREAKTLAALSHPHICAVYDVGSQDGIDFLVMEHLEGETLAQRLAKGRPLPLDQALQVAIQIADALDKAHRKGIVHRDLKPGNIMLTKSGAQLLDFGLAKVRPPRVAGGVALSEAPTVSSPLTGAGSILGTFQDMAPEQLEGQEADARTDIFAFGAVVYEMVTGKRAFDAKTQASLIATILEREPPAMSLVQPLTPPVLDHVVRRCLAKPSDDRWQSASDVMRELKWIAEGTITHVPELTKAGQPRRMAARLLPWAVTTVFGVALAGMFVLWTSSRSTFSAAPVTFGILSALDQPLVPNNNDRQFDLSPDGTRIVYASGASNTGGPIAVRNLGQLQPVTLLGISSGRAPFFSADGQWVGFFDLAALAFKKTPSTGGPVITVCRLAAAPRGVVWGPDDTIVFASSDPSTGLLSVAASGGEPVVLTKANSGQGESDHVFPSLLPDGRTVVFTVTGQKGIDDAIAVLNRDTGTWKTVIHGGSNARYVDSGHLVYTSGTTLFAVRFDPVRLQVESTPTPIIDALAIAPTTGAAQYSISPTGTLAYMPPSGAFAEVRSVVWVDRTGREEHLNVPPRAYWTARLSPDGNRVALDIREPGGGDAWIWDFPRQTLTRLTFTPALDYGPQWTPDGRHIVTGGSGGLFWRLADGSGTEVRLTSADDQREQLPMSFTPDGKSLVVAETKQTRDLMLLTMGTDVTRPLVESPSHEIVGELSPDGRWLAYQSNEDGQFQIYVRPFPNVTGGRWQVSQGGGMKPAWDRSGRELFYLDDEGRLTSVPVQTNGTFSPGNAKRLLETRYFSAVQFRSYDVSPDGRRFLMIKDVPRDASAGPRPEIIVTLNWFEELKTKVPLN